MQNKLISKLKKELHIKISAFVKVLPISRSTFYVYAEYYENEFEHELIPDNIIKLFDLIMNEAKTGEDAYNYVYDIFKCVDTDNTDTVNADNETPKNANYNAYGSKLDDVREINRLRDENLELKLIIGDMQLKIFQLNKKLKEKD